MMMDIKEVIQTGRPRKTRRDDVMQDLNRN